MSEPHLARHLASMHADGLALTRPLADNLDAHRHEHTGPGTIRNHDPGDLSWDRAKLDRVVAELVADDPGFSCPELVLANPNAHPIHKDIARINLRVRDLGERWAKCPNCGQPYQLTEEWSDSSICSDVCAEEYTSYLFDPGAL